MKKRKKRIDTLGSINLARYEGLLDNFSPQRPHGAGTPRRRLGFRVQPVSEVITRYLTRITMIVTEQRALESLGPKIASICTFQKLIF